MKHGQLTQTLDPDQDVYKDTGGFNVTWYGSPVNRPAIDRDLTAYLKHSTSVVDDAVKRFDPGFVITVDGRRPVGELLKTVEARLTTMSLHRAVLPTVPDQGSDGSENLPQRYEFEEEEEIRPEYDENELVRLTSEFGRLCPVNHYHGSYIPGKRRYRARYWGKLYYLAGPEEYRAFNECPRRYLNVPEPGLPIRAVFYGHRTFSGPAAKAVSDSYGAALIDVQDIETDLRETYKRTFVSAVVDSTLRTARRVTGVREDPSFEIGVVKDALGEWIRVYFDDDYTDEHEPFGGMECDGSDCEVSDEHTDRSNRTIYILT